MKERPILMQGWGVRAILDDSKTHTRRVIKPQPNYSILKAGVKLEPHRCPCLGPAHYGRSEWGLYGAPYHPSDVPCFGYDCPYGNPGDLLYAKETWAVLWNKDEPDWEQDETVWDVPHYVEYRADSNALYPGEWPAEEARGNPEAPKWQPSTSMPKRVARLWLRITDIRVERVQEISTEDAITEGVQPIAQVGAVELYRNKNNNYGNARQAFEALWDSINAKRGYSWKSNPWVWVVVFERIGGIDE